MIYTVTFNPAIDYIARLGAPLKPGAINRNAAEDVFFGGKGVNVSLVLRALGMDSVALGFIAGFTGDALENGLRAAGLHTDFIRLPQGLTRINVKVQAQEETEINGIGPAITQANLENLYEKLGRLTSEDTLVLSGSIPGCLGADTYEIIMQRLESSGVRIAVDASGALLVNVLRYRPFLIKPNHIELGEIFGCVPLSDAQLISNARSLQAMGARNVLVSMAGDGALLLEETGAVHRMPCPKGEVLGSVGAGDSMVAGFLAGYLETGDCIHALRLGVAAGSATAFSPGLASREAIDALLASI